MTQIDDLLSLAMDVLRYAEQAQKTLALAPKAPSYEGEILSPIQRRSRQRHAAFAGTLRRLGYAQGDDDVFRHKDGAAVSVRQLAHAWEVRSNAEILSVLAWVRRRPALSRDLWLAEGA